MSPATANKTFCSTTCDLEYFERFEKGELEFSIELGVAIPPKYNGKIARWRGLIDKMKIGSSVLFPNKVLAQSLGLALKAAGFDYTTRVLEFGCRVWKMEAQIQEEPTQ